MTINFEQMNENYRNADFVCRLHLYLQFPELRNDFLLIHLEEKNSAFFKSVNVSDKDHSAWTSLTKWMRNLF